jgi:crotonobetainyl-CoA:carnitine CoA-transferase CaiB-like acyl-CoA transferase
LRDDQPRLGRSSTRAGPGALVGQHTNAILEQLGYSSAEIGALIASGVARQG